MHTFVTAAVAIIIGALVIAGAGMLTIWFIDRDPPVEFRSIEVVTKEVRPGDPVKVRFSLIRKRNDCHVVIDRLLFDGEGVRSPVEDEDFNASPGPLGKDVFMERLMLSDHAEPGEGRVRTIRAYFCNPIQRWFGDPIIVRTPDVPFTILPR